MSIRSIPQRLHFAFTILIGSVWVFHGLYSKLLNGVPRHRAIVGRVLGEEWAALATLFVGGMEIALGLWAYSRWRKKECAVVQTLAIAAMNTLEIMRARDLLLSAPGMLILNAGFLAVVWTWALSVSPKR